MFAVMEITMIHFIRNLGQASALNFLRFCDFEYSEFLNSFLTFSLKYRTTDRKKTCQIVENQQ